MRLEVCTTVLLVVPFIQDCTNRRKMHIASCHSDEVDLFIHISEEGEEPKDAAPFTFYFVAFFLPLYETIFHFLYHLIRVGEAT